jgi:hypothetical protein
MPSPLRFAKSLLYLHTPKLKEMKKYNIIVEANEINAWLDVTASDNGEWVKAEEAQAEIDRLQAEIEALKNSQEWRTDWENVKIGTVIVTREPFRIINGVLNYTYDGFVTQRLYSSIGFGLRAEKREFKIIEP